MPCEIFSTHFLINYLNSLIILIHSFRFLRGNLEKKENYTNAFCAFKFYYLTYIWNNKNNKNANINNKDTCLGYLPKIIIYNK